MSPSDSGNIPEGSGYTPPEHVSALALLSSFLRLGASSFGGGMTGWTHREIVERRKWLSEQEFLQTLTIAQILPGANPVNLAVYIGLKLGGLRGAAISLCGMILPAFIVILLLSYSYQQLRVYPEAQAVLRGLACVGIGASLTMGLKTASRLPRHIFQIGVALGVFFVVGVLSWPLIPVVAVAIPLSVALTFYQERLKDRG